MAFRTNEVAIREAIETDSTVSLVRYLRMANKVTDYVASKDTDSILDAETLAEIETLLAAHFYQCLRDKQYTSKSTGGASGSFQGQYGMRFESTDPGQAAIALDFTGTLATLSKGLQGSIQMQWLGKPPSEQIDYLDRD